MKIHPSCWLYDECRGRPLGAICVWLDGAPQGSQCLCPPSAVLSVLSSPVSGLSYFYVLSGWLMVMYLCAWESQKVLVFAVYVSLHWFVWVFLWCLFEWKWLQAYLARSWPLALSPVGAHFTRHQHSHATSCRHFHLGSPQAPISAEFPLGHASQPPQTGLATHLPPAHHPPLTALPAPPQFQDVPGPPFLPQALHQQYLIQQQLLEAQHRRILPHSR